VPPLPADSARPFSPVTWHLRAGDRARRFTLKVRSSTGVTEAIKVHVNRPRTGVLD
jgi:hypothetical protein